jgi:hypothetical protein
MFVLRHLAVVAICFLAASLRVAEATTLVTNGGFEAQAFMQTNPSGNQYRYVPSDLYPITGWTFTSTGNGENSYLVAAGPNYGNVPEGDYALRLSIGDSISQAIVPPAPGVYSVSIATQNWQVSYSDLLMTIGGTGVVIPIGTSGTTQFTTSLSGSTTLAIDWLAMSGQEADAQAEDFNGHGVYVDAISVTAVPEPSLGVVGLGGGAALAAIGRRCRGRSRLR